MSTSRRLAYLLIVSLAVNLFLGGLYAGQWLEDWRRGPDFRHLGPMRFHFGAFVDDLPRDAQVMARDAVERHRGELRAAIGGLRQARRDARAALRAEPFVPQDLEAALSALRQHAGEAHLAMHRAMLELTPKLSPEGRRALADSLGGPPHRPLPARTEER